jgi:hypothetical protein
MLGLADNHVIKQDQLDQSACFQQVTRRVVVAG